jgi:hypothetical protein
MSPFSSEEFARGVIRIVQIIVAALAMGMICFAAVAIFQRIPNPPQQDALIAYLAAGFAPMMLFVRAIVGTSTVNRSRKNIAAGIRPLNPPAAGSQLPANFTGGDQFLFVFQQKTIIESALVEGAAFFNLIAFLTEGQWWSLAVAGVLLAVLLVPFPTYDRVENWVRYQLELLELERQS